ncbi:MAG TPA: TldD/PmbA family protein [Marmoricola sp.]|nr:TldD/PmbA family protein [Marmoricola sp.]
MKPLSVDPSFLALPYRQLADIALNRASERGATHADFRFERIRTQYVAVRDHGLDGAEDHTDLGFAVRVILNGAWGFAASTECTPSSALEVADHALELARLTQRVTRTPVALAPEPLYSDAFWSSTHEINPFDVLVREKVDLLQSWTEDLLSSNVVSHATASVLQIHENKFYADLAGTRTTQQRIRLEPVLEAHGYRGDIFDSMRTIAPPAARGWEYLQGAGFDFDRERAELPDLLDERLRAPSVEPGAYDLVIHPSNLWLTIHESVGHATELDRALGFEAGYAGTSFATPDHLGTLKYGSELMNVTADRTVEYGLASIGYDDDGVATTTSNLVADGVLVGYQLDRATSAAYPAVNGGRSNGCSFADSPLHVPLQRMANVSLQPSKGSATTEQLIAGVEHGLYIVGDKSWSIDMQRYNFQFTGQRFYRIENGQLIGQVRDAAYQATTTDFWGSLVALGGPETYELGGAFNCGKAQPGQTAAVSHGCPTAVFTNIRILNAAEETS